MTTLEEKKMIINLIKESVESINESDNTFEIIGGLQYWVSRLQEIGEIELERKLRR